MKKLFLLFLLILLTPLAFAHEESSASIDKDLKENSVLYLYLAGTISALFVVYAIYAEKKPHFTNKRKIFVFLGIIIPIILSTIYLIGTTLYVNSISESGGPVHWHADFEIYVCGNKIELKSPTGLSNKIGTEVLHHHGDNRIHVEGVLVKKGDADLHSFFEVIGGELTDNNIAIPAKSGLLTYSNGDSCNGDTGKPQVFVYKTKGTTVTQEKLTNFEDYILSPEVNVPPADCIIIEFDKEKSETNHICETYRIALARGNK